ncbi:MAG: hypothetical protein ACUVRQ_01675 [Thermoanaerobaculaceae bacterium]
MRGLVRLLLTLVPLPLFGQAVTQGKTTQGLPWAVVELPGGDTEIVAAWLPPGAPVPLGWEEAQSTWPRVVVKEELAGKGIARLMESLEELEAVVAVALVGPSPARELSGLLAKLEGAKPAQPPKSVCSFTDGVVDFVRADREGFALTLPAPGPEDGSWELTELAVFLAERRWQQLGFSGPVRWRAGPCPTVTLEDHREEPRRRLAQGREMLGELGKPVEPFEQQAYRSWKLRETARWAVDPKAVAVEACQRLGWGRALGPMFYPPQVSPKAASELMAKVFGLFRGRATVFERERRATAPESETLPNGVSLLLQPIAADFGLLAVAFSGVAPQAAQEVARSFGVEVVKQGYPAETVAVAGMVAVVVVANPAELTENLERLAMLLSREASPTDPLVARGLQALGLGSRIAGENVAVLLQLPEGEEEVLEAVHKFLASLPSGSLLRGGSLEPGLVWQDADAPAEIAAFCELPESLPGAVLGQVLVRRLAAQGINADLNHQPGRLLLRFWGGGAESLQAQDAILERTWESARLLSAREILSAWPEFLQALSGSAAKVAMRQVMGVFFSGFGHLAPPEEEEVAGLLQRLPGYRSLPRLGMGRWGGGGSQTGKGE